MFLEYCYYLFLNLKIYIKFKNGLNIKFRVKQSLSLTDITAPEPKTYFTDKKNGYP